MNELSTILVVILGLWIIVYRLYDGAHCATSCFSKKKKKSVFSLVIGPMSAWQIQK